MNFKNIYLKLPFRRTVKLSFLRKLSDLLAEGYALLEILNLLANAFSNRRIKIVISIINNKVRDGHDFIHVISEFNNLFDNEFIVLASKLQNSNTSITFKSIVDVYIEILQEKGALIKYIIIPVLPIFVLSMGIFIGIVVNVYSTLIPLESLIIKTGTLTVPAAVTATTVSVRYTVSFIIPLVLFFISIPIINSVLKLPFLNKLYSFVMYYTPIISYFTRFNERINFISVLYLLVKNGTFLQDALTIYLGVIKNDITRKKYLSSLKMIHSGSSVQDAFSGSNILANNDKDNIFTSRGSLELVLFEIKEKYKVRRKTIYETLISFIRLFFIFFSIYWILAFSLAWLALTFTYILKIK